MLTLGWSSPGKARTGAPAPRSIAAAATAWTAQRSMTTRDPPAGRRLRPASPCTPTLSPPARGRGRGRAGRSSPTDADGKRAVAVIARLPCCAFISQVGSGCAATRRIFQWRPSETVMRGRRPARPRPPSVMPGTSRLLSGSDGLDPWQDPPPAPPASGRGEGRETLPLPSGERAGERGPPGRQLAAIGVTAERGRRFPRTGAWHPPFRFIDVSLCAAISASAWRASARR